ncbi:MAG: AraC family transcriptional regulator [Bacillota bacterium]
MNHMVSIQKAIDYIEENITEELTLENIASQANFSMYHFHRIFSVVVGESVKGYINKRRLSCAALQLLRTERRIIDIAFEYGFESQEVFTRAFLKHHGITPGRCRRLGRELSFYERVNLLYREKIYSRRDPFMEPKIVVKKSFEIVGLPCRTTDEENRAESTIGKSWLKFMPRIGEVKNISYNASTYGLCTSVHDPQREGEFMYICSIEVDKVVDIPEGMIAKSVPEGKYAVFTHKGEVGVGTEADLFKTYEYIYKIWLPQSGYVFNRDSYDFECYDQRFNGDSPEFDIYIPIK